MSQVRRFNPLFRRTTLESCKLGCGPHVHNHSVTYIKFRHFRPGTLEPPSLVTSREEESSNNACVHDLHFQPFWSYTNSNLCSSIIKIQTRKLHWNLRTSLSIKLIKFQCIKNQVVSKVSLHAIYRLLKKEQDEHCMEVVHRSILASDK